MNLFPWNLFGNRDVQYTRAFVQDPSKSLEVCPVKVISFPVEKGEYLICTLDTIPSKYINIIKI